MKIEEFKKWMKEFCDFNDTTINNRISNCKKIESSYGDLEDIFRKDKCLQIINDLSYTTKDERENLPPKHIIPINGNVRNGSATLKRAVNLYVEFETDFSEQNNDADSVLDIFQEDEEEIIGDKNEFKNGFNSLYNLIKSENEFVEFFVMNTLFIHPDYIEKQADEMLERIDKNEKIPVRFSQKMKEYFKSEDKRISTIKNRRDAVNFSRDFDFYSKIRPDIKVEFDSTGNKFVVDAIEKYTNCRVSTSQSHIINYSISHVWGKTNDPLFFSSLWNIVLVPSYLNPIMDKPKHQHELNGHIQSLIRSICIELYNPNSLLEDLTLVEEENSSITQYAKSLISKGVINYIDLN